MRRGIVPKRRRKSKRRGPSGSSARVTRTKSGKTTSHHTGGLSITGMVPTGRVAGSRPTIRATVVDRGTRLSKQDIRLYLDGSEKSRFHYDPVSGRLSYYVGSALSSGIHEVRVEAGAESSGDEARTSGKSSKRWTFSVKK